MRNAISGVLGALVLASTTGCIVQIEHTSNPDAAFDQAREEAAAAFKEGGSARDVKILVYDRGDENIVRVNVPLWLAKKLSKDDDGDFLKGEGIHVGQKVRLEDLEKGGKGTVIEVEGDEGERVLVYLR
jgi:hypothetical protein